MFSLDQLLEKLLSYMPDADVDLVRKAYAWAEKAHEGVRRLSGRPFIQHPLAVADLVATLRLDVPSICAALLHDVKEDNPEVGTGMDEEFGPEIAAIVDGVTKLEKYRFMSREERQAENFKKMLVAMSRDIRVLIVKLCDRLNNMRELDYHSEEKQREISQETLQIYAPLAERLGIGWIRNELEDLCFKFLYPEEYRSVKEAAENRLKERSRFIRHVIETIREALDGAGLKGYEVTGRPKHLFGIFKKMRAQGIDLDHVYDFVAFRVIVEEVVQCWLVMGLIHSMWTPIPARFKDFINVPKPNGYRSLHTTVFGPMGEPMEVQIRTWEMHRSAESGIAAHWVYKEGGRVVLRDQQKFNWLRQLIEWAQELRNPKQFMETVQDSLFTDQVFVFTPKGDLKVLPRGATPVDFAYEIHTEVGHNCVGARVNNRLVPLSTQLKSGNMVEIITTKKGRPKRDWLSFVVTAKATNKIRAFFAAEARAHAIEIGKQLLDRSFKAHGLKAKDTLEKGADHGLFERFRAKNLEALYRTIGEGKVAPLEVVKFFRPDATEQESRPEEEKRPSKLLDLFRRRPKGIAVDGVEDMLLRIAKCCNPIPGDDIVGFVTRGRGVTVHRADCLNIKGIPGERLIPAHWCKGLDGLFGVPVAVRCIDEPGVLARVTKEIGDRNCNIESIVTRPAGDHVTEVRMVLDVEDLSKLDSILRALSRTKGVLKAYRLRSF